MSTDNSKVVFRKSNRVILRPVLKEDSVLMLKWINDPDVTVYLESYLPMMEADEEHFFTQMKKDKEHNVVLVIVVKGKSLGTMGLHKIDWRNGIATTGALIGEKEFWGKGYGSEAKMLLLDYAFNTLNLRKIYSDVLSFNTRSAAYSKKCGYKEEAVLKDHYYRFGRHWDEHILSVFKEDWLPLWKKFREEHGIKLPFNDI